MTKNISEDTKAEVAPTREMLESYGTKVYVNDEISESCWTFQNKTWLVNSDDTITRSKVGILSGKVVDNYGNSVENAMIKLEGVESLEKYR